MQNSPSDSLTGQVVAGRYRLEALIGEGGMGCVYRATSAGGDAVAVKILRRGTFGGEAMARFLREAKLTRALQSPHVVPILETGHDPTSDALFIAMELFEGADVDALVQRVGPLHPITAVRIALQAAKGLSAAHRIGVVHRDVKPANLLLQLSAGSNDVSVRVCDFGVAKQIDDAEQLTATGTRVGSPLYMSPEQLKSSKHVDARTDVWSLGATIYEMLSGNAPLAGIESVAELFMSIPTRDAPDLATVARWVPPELARVVHKALERDVARRFASMDAFAEALAPHSGGDHLLTRAMLTGVPDELMPSDDALEETAVDGRSAHEITGDPLIGRTLDGRFRVVGVLGRGGMGAVYEVETQDGSHLAAKVISGAGIGDPHAVKRLLREARAASDIESPHVLKTLETSTDAGLGAPFVLMELLQGMDVGMLLQREGALEPRIAARIFIQAARGLAAAHARGIIHRDVKPANLFLHTEPGTHDVTAKVCDFGIAKLADADHQTQELTRTGGMIGSPLYMSPEQARNAKHVDFRTDIWSLSVTLWEALAGRRLWEGSTALGEIILAICGDPIPDLTEAAPWVDPALAAVVHKGLSRDPGARWASLDELTTALEPFAGGSQVVRTEDLEGISAERRHEISPRLSVGSAASAVSADAPTIAATHQASTIDVIAPPPSRRTAMLGAAATVLVLVVGGTVALTRSQTTTPGVDRPAQASPAASARLSMSIRPPSATVTIDGAPAEVRDGHVELVGAPGDSFDVVVRSGSAEKRVRAFITRERTLSPDRAELEQRTAPADSPATATAPSPPAPTKRPPTPKPCATVAAAAATPPPAPAHPAPTAVAAPLPASALTPTPTATATPQIKPKDEW